MASHITLPTYEVEFIPLERRLREDRRKRSTYSYRGSERRQYRSRRDSEPAAASSSLRV